MTIQLLNILIALSIFVCLALPDTKVKPLPAPPPPELDDPDVNISEQLSVLWKSLKTLAVRKSQKVWREFETLWSLTVRSARETAEQGREKGVLYFEMAKTGARKAIHRISTAVKDCISRAKGM
ncbi:hypothetical protein PoB_007354300 [Plakobranchus ocellatus]|uniref:Uncharacterized protein n=1 Tax=Plakobranchus ocellatus TaxID=259542 RepID=A0AAV4DRS2_9GAST|nr:hypothetical protein PoB_007354300 [Plakobranchus ocellatus]